MPDTHIQQLLFMSQESGVGSLQSGVCSQESAVRSLQSGVCSQESAVRSLQSPVHHLTTSPPHHLTTSPSHPLTTSFTLLPISFINFSSLSIYILQKKK